MQSPAHGLFVTGTDTDVGKTHIGAAIATGLTARGIRVRVRKPVESGAADSPDGLLPTDALRLNRAAGNPDPLSLVCPFPLRQAISPKRAARLEGRRLSIAQLRNACLHEITDDDYLLVEGAGGFYSPLCEDGLNADLAAELGLPLLLVVADRLGCINHALLTLEAIERRGLSVQAMVLNRSAPTVTGNDTEAMDNAEDLAECSGRTVIALPWCAGDRSDADLMPADREKLLAGLE